MCGRFTLAADSESIKQAFNLDSADAWETPRYNIAPTQQVAVITDREPKTLSLMKWGLIPSWAKDPNIGSRMINARSETAHEKPSFRAAFKRRRCLIPATGYYEWHRRGQQKTPVYIQHAERAIFAFAGLWENWQTPDGDWQRSCAILTTDANAAIRAVHHRMTVIIEPQQVDLWLARRALEPYEWQPLMAGPRDDQLRFHAVSRQVNSVRNDDPTLILPEAAPEAGPLL